jgi:hypothetical protein
MKENAAQLFFKKVDALFEGDTKSQHEAYSSLKLNEHNPLVEHYNLTYYGKCIFIEFIIMQMSESPDFWWRLAKATHLKATAAGNNGDQQLKKIQAFEGTDCTLHSYFSLHFTQFNIFSLYLC